MIVVAALIGAVPGARAFEDNLAFPGAIGFGQNANGWRGGEIVKVTTLDDAGTGSLRHCAEDRRRPRVCVFDISGTIEVSRPIRVSSGTYIAGQTAPGKGIQIKLGKSQLTPIVVKNSENVLIRFLKLRPGNSSKLSANVDGITIESSRNVYLDHLSVQFATDESINIHTNRFPTQDITIARTIVATSLDKANHPKGRHSKGALICSNENKKSAPCGRISLIENLFAHHRDRNPDLKGTYLGPIEVMNNVFYNAISQYGEFYDLIGDTRINYIGNVVLTGPSTRKKNKPAAVEVFDWNDKFTISIFMDDNLYISGKHCKALMPERLIDQDAEKYLAKEPFQPMGHRAIPAVETLDHVLATAGARLPDGRFLDLLDKKVISDVKKCAGRVIDSPQEAGGWPDLPVVRGAPDSDNDGMPDRWESERNGLNPLDASDTWLDRDGDGWTNLEEYLSILAGDFQ